MGRAAPRKAQRRDGRTWSTVNPWTGRPESFHTRLSDQALAEWEAERTELAASGYPDRPPDIDTSTSRGWCAESSGPFPAEDGVAMMGCDPTARMIGMWYARADDFMLKASLGRRPDGRLVVGVAFGSVLAPHHVVATGVKSVESAAKNVRDLAVALGLPEPAFVSEEQLMADLAMASDNGLAAA